MLLSSVLSSKADEPHGFFLARVAHIWRLYAVLLEPAKGLEPLTCGFRNRLGLTDPEQTTGKEYNWEILRCGSG